MAGLSEPENTPEADKQQRSVIAEDFLPTLRAAGFAGDIGDDCVSRLVGATDNSIYRLVPSLVLFPANQDDLQKVLYLAHQHGLDVTARGGGTGTNGQSLSEGVVLDVSRHMNRILSFDPDSETVVVEPGVVLDQLNAFLAPYGYFFPPTVSTSSRATVGGMFGTDASGKGSRIYGRMSDYVRKAHILLEDASAHVIGETCEPTGRLAELCREIGADLEQNREAIREIFPDMNRGLTGYNLLDAIPNKAGSPPDLVKLLAGSEGTLAFTTQLHLRVIRKPTHRALSVLAYEDCLAALAHVPALIEAEPTAIEFLDDRIVDLASQSAIWSEVKDVLGPLKVGRGFLFVEFSGYDDASLSAAQSRLADILAKDDGGNLGLIATQDGGQISSLWEMRKRAVGLLGASEGGRVGLPFVEDAAVPPENLVAFVRDFRALLDAENLSYGMFGHADVGCVHVRPMLDMRLSHDRAMIRILSDKVSALCQRYDGLIWGEHGKGMRGEYLLAYVGPDLFGLMRRIKACFDPDGRLNAGKLTLPAGQSGQVVRLDQIPMRGERDGQIDMQRFASYDKAIACNGNGACYNWSPSDPMCPSYKASRDRAQGPKGRATLFREWTYARSQNALARDASEPDHDILEQGLYDSLSTCLSCHSCSNSCPVQVDIPTMKSHFLAYYFTRHRRPLRDYLVQHMERLGLMARHIPAFANWLLGSTPSRLVLEKLFQLVDVPQFARRRAEAILRAYNMPVLRGARTGSIPAQGRTVCLVIDSFVGSYETELLEASIICLRAFGFQVYASPVFANGKAQQVRGFLPAFTHERDAAVALLNDLASHDMPLIGLEPSVLELCRRDYQKGTGRATFSIQSLDQFLHGHIQDLRDQAFANNDRDYHLFLHCTEKTADPQTGPRWQAIFSALNLHLTPVKTGCCGMAGLFGHEAEHKPMSEKLYDMSWREPMDQAQKSAHHVPMATGFSCRSQTKRQTGQKPLHPIQILSDLLVAKGS